MLKAATPAMMDVAKSSVDVGLVAELVVRAEGYARTEPKSNYKHIHLFEFIRRRS